MHTYEDMYGTITRSLNVARTRCVGVHGEAYRRAHAHANTPTCVGAAWYMYISTGTVYFGYSNWMSRSVPVDKETRTYPFSRFTTLLYQVHRANKNLVKTWRFTTLLYQVHRANKNLVKTWRFTTLL
jgi:hypothetical protein